MTFKDSAWILHIDSLPSEMYTYRFYDGNKKFLDPCNLNVVRDITDTLNYFIIDGVPGSYYKKQNVPHGKVYQLWYPSSFNENMKQRRLSVYLPADYEMNIKKKYPVLYLLHGTGGDEMAWLDMGRLAQIMDNMIAQGKIKPMIVIMPNGIVDLDAAPGQSPYMQGKASHSNVSSWMGRTEKAFPGTIITADLGSIDMKGRLRLHGRSDDVINVGGYKIAPTEVEDIALAFSGVKDCICIEAPHPVVGKVLKLLIVPDVDYNRKNLVNYLKSKLESHKVPVLYDEIAEVRRTFNGKIDRKSYR